MDECNTIGGISCTQSKHIFTTSFVSTDKEKAAKVWQFIANIN